MDNRIYNLRVGSTFLVYGCGFNCQDAFRVCSINADIARCCQETSGQILMLPLNVSMPFAICILPDEFGQRDSGSASQGLSVCNVSSSKKASSEMPNQASMPLSSVKPKRIDSKIEYFNPVEHWGKIHCDRMPHGLFFHITQVEDEKLRTFLGELSVGSKITPLKVSYIKSYNPNHHNSVCAGAIRAEEELPQTVTIDLANTANHTGFISEFEISGAILIIADNQTFRTKVRTQIDPLLKAYLENYSTSGLLDNQNLEVSFTTIGRLVLRVEWTNKEKIISEQGITLNNYVSDEEIEAFNRETDNTSRGTFSIPAYQELPAWISD